MNMSTYRIREGQIESGPKMDWNMWYVQRQDGVNVAGPFRTKREAKWAMESYRD
jgi:hypothetical protein